jgi:two-component system chemotaxis sensor kinase CheA
MFYHYQLLQSTLRVNSSDIKTIDGNEVMMYREEIIPIFHISDILDVKIDEAKTDTKKTIVVVNNGTKLIGLIVDSFERNQEFVIKRLDNLLSFANSFTNTTILSDGHPALILDPSLLVQ